MKKRISSIRKIFVTVLAAALISGMTVPAAAFAQEAETQEDPVIMEEENSETELQKAETPEEEEITDAETPEEEESTDTEKATETETEELTDTEDPTELEDPEEENPTEPEDPEEEEPAEPKNPEEEDPTVPDNPGTEDPTENPEGEDPAGTETPGTETPVIPPVTIPPMAMAVPMDTSDSMYAQLEQFLTLIADRFQIYTVAVVELTDPTNPSDPSAWQPTVPEEAVEVSLAIPEGYDPSRTVVAEIGQSAGSQMPAWTEITYQNINGGAVFKTDHSGLFVIAEEKQWKDIPASLEMTSKVDRLELTKVYPSDSRTSGALPASLKYSTSVPLTGDDYSVFIWGAITVLAAAAVIAGIIIIIKRRK
ncbi:hypothetical protein [Lachnoclostridium sp. An76]|uniref:hypothetical protein n=1 Tax=Lachnoclostridium sp. An76 TaxID=1965654 RepID=UPI000B38D2DA|nr:hypothetical protein [Lachnoclostridium sp. An76]OUN34946.1 hypothetical protein B5G27_04585 [Lachnoclostridium sp. An76]